jgi:hypothetical protein
MEILHQIYDLKVFLPYLLIVSFEAQKCLILIDLRVPIFSFIYLAFDVQFKNLSTNLSQKFNPLFFLGVIPLNSFFQLFLYIV